jgi:hypothetical protein
MNTEPEDYSHPPQDKTELMQRIQREWAALERAVDGLSDEQMSVPDTGGWSIKDNLAHLAAWEHYMRQCHLRNLPPHEVMGVDKETYEKLDENGLNEILFQRNRHRSVPEILAELRGSHEQTLADLEQMSFADLMKPRYADDPETRPVIIWVTGNTYEHYKEHRAVIEKLAQI